MNINAKIKLIADTITGYSVLVDSSNGANVELDKLDMPAIVVFIQDNGEYLGTNSHYRDSVNIRIALFNLIPNGFKESDVETLRYNLKQDMVLLYHRLKFDFQFKINSDVLKYETVYDEMDANLIGVVFSDSIKERVGINYSCETPDSIGVNPSAQSFCERVSECSTIISLGDLIEDLQTQIDNISGGGLTCDDLANCQTIISIDENVNTLTSDFASHTNDSTNPHSTNLGHVLSVSNSTENMSIISPDANSVLNVVDGGVDVFKDSYLGGESLMRVSETVALLSFDDLTNSGSSTHSSTQNEYKHTIKNTFTAPLNTFSANVQISNATTNKLAYFDTNKYLKSLKLGANLSFSSGTLSVTGCELIANKATSFSILNNTLYPTTQAVNSLVGTYIQSNIKIIGDWNASSGLYPKNDESNTTPFITQWGATIKAGWAFRVGYGQAGTVSGFDYENGDVVYALIDNATNSSSDWGDLDHNLQQANESTRGTSKAITAAIIADETTTDDERYVTGKKIWANFWTRVLAIAHTFAAKITFTTAPRFSSTTASQRLEVDANKDLISVAKGTADNKNFGTTLGTVLEGDRITQTITNGVTDKIPSEDAVYDALANKQDKTNWTDISASSTITGWSSYTVKKIFELVENNKVTIFFYLSGTSNSATTNFTVTNNANANLDNFYAPSLVVNNGTASSNAGRATINASTNEVYFVTTWVNSATFTATGTKSVRGTIIYYK